MSDLRPILHDNPTEHEKLLLGSATLDAPPAAAKGRVLAALGFAAVTTTTAGAGGATTVATSGTALLIKWLAIGAMGSAITIGAVEQLLPPTPRSTWRPAHAVALPVAASAPPTSPPLSAAVPERQVVEREAPPAPRAAAPAAAATRARPASPPSSAHETVPVTSPTQPSLTAEVTSLGVARRALASGEALTALSLLDGYDQRFAQPALAPEATILRIEALVALGRIDEARGLAREMLTAQPATPYAQRLRSLVGTAASPP